MGRFCVFIGVYKHAQGDLGDNLSNGI